MRAKVDVGRIREPLAMEIRRVFQQMMRVVRRRAMLVIALAQALHVRADLLAKAAQRQRVDQRVDARGHFGEDAEHGGGVGVDEMIEAEEREKSHESVRSPGGTEDQADEQGRACRSRFRSTNIARDLTVFSGVVGGRGARWVLAVSRENGLLIPQCDQLR